MSLSALSWFTLPDSLVFWNSLVAASIVIVCIGAWGEVWAEHKQFPNEPKGQPNEIIPIEQMKTDWELAAKAWRKNWESRFWRIFLVGIAIQLVAFGFSVTISGKQIAKLKHENLVLQAKMQPRIITVEQIKDFTVLMSLVTKKIPIRISIGQGGFDTEAYAKQMRGMFTFAGFETDSICGLQGVFRDPSRHTSRNIRNDHYSPAVEIVYYETNQSNFGKRREETVEFLATKSPYTNFPSLPVVTDYDSDAAKKVFIAIDLGLKRIGIPVEWIPQNQWVKSNEFEIFIPVKNQ